METLFTAEEIQNAVRRTAAEVQAHFGTETEVCVLALLNGALWFAADLLRALPPNFILETARVSSYGDAMQSSGSLTWRTAVPGVAGKRVLVLDDVLDTGITLHHVVEALHGMGAAEVRTAVAVEKAGCRRLPFEADFTALHAGADFLVGYGMDAAQRYRNLPHIARM